MTLIAAGVWQSDVLRWTLNKQSSKGLQCILSLIISFYAELHLVLRLRMSGDIPLLPLYALMACMGTALPFFFLVSICMEVISQHVYILCKWYPVIESYCLRHSLHTQVCKFYYRKHKWSHLLTVWLIYVIIDHYNPVPVCYQQKCCLLTRFAYSCKWLSIQLCGALF